MFSNSRLLPTIYESPGGEGYSINHPMVPWLNYAELLERQRTYDPALFQNE